MIEDTFIPAIQDKFPFGVTLQNMWEELLNHGGNNPFVTKENVSLALRTITKEDVRHYWGEKRRPQDYKGHSRSAKKVISYSKKNKVELILAMFGDKGDNLDLTQVIYELYKRRVVQFITSPATGKTTSAHVSLRHPSEFKWDTDNSGKDPKGGKKKTEYFSTQTKHLRGMIKQLNFITHGIIFLGEE